MKSIYFLFLVTLVCVLPLQAQQSKNDSTYLNRELTLEKEYNPIIRDASKIKQLPDLVEPQAPKSKVEFSNYENPYEIAPSLSLLKAHPYFTDVAYSKNRGYLTVGVSSLVDINGDIGYQILNTDKDFLSIYASHRSSNSNVTYLQDDEKQKMKINDNLGGIDYIHNFGKLNFLADIRYTYSAFNYYGINIGRPESSIWNFEGVDKSINQVNNLFKAHLGVVSTDNNEIMYKANLAYTLFKQKYGEVKNNDGRKENRFMADFDLHTYYNSTGMIGVGAYFKNYSYDVPYFSNYNDEEEDYKKLMSNYNYSTLSLNPYVTFEGDNWDVRLGATANMHFGGRKKFIAAPDIRLNWFPTQKFLVYLEAVGGIKDNSNYETYYENRYLNPNYRILDSRSPLDATFGINFSPVSNLEVHLFTGYKITKDEHFYTATYNARADNDRLMGHNIIPEYADANTFKFGGALKYVYQDIFDVGLKLVYYNWDVDSDNEEGAYYNYSQKAWNKPDFTGDISMGFKVPSLPLRFDLNYYLETGRKALNNYSEVNMKNINDLSFKGSYSFNKNFSVYVSTNNLLFQKYDLWYGYPAQNFNIMGGISVKF